MTLRKGTRQVYKYYILAHSLPLSGAHHVASGCDRGYAKISDRNYAKSPAHGATDCVRFGAESRGVMERAGEDVFSFFVVVVRRGGGGGGGGGDGGWGRRRVREEVRKTCPSLHDPVQSRQRVSATTRCNAESARRNETISRIRITTPVSGESNYSWYERTFPPKRNIILLPRGRPRERTGQVVPWLLRRLYRF